MAPYPYESLASSHRDIRLLTLHGALEETDPLSGSISHHSLNNALVYDALSYTWSYDLVGSPIHIDGVAFNIGPNLESALRHIRCSDDRTLWIDAICIDQENENERKQQVQLMQWIFGSAKRVIAWLGTATFDSGLAMRTLEQLEEKDVIQMAKAGFTCPRWVALKNLWSRPFWGRIWIVQEIVLGNGRVRVQCGHDHITRCTLERAFKTLRSHLDNPSTLLWEGLDCNMDWFMNLLTVCCGYDDKLDDPQRSQHLEDLLDFTGHFLATDPRDHVYALLGLLRDRGRTAIEPDYSMTLKQVYANTVKELVSSKGTLMVLNGNRSTKIKNLSSWMPIFGDHVRRGYGWRDRFKASGYDAQPCVKFSECCTLLMTKGVLVDHVYAVQGPFENEQGAFHDPNILAHMDKMSVHALSRKDRHKLLPTMESTRTAFLKTLTSNTSEGTNDSGEEYNLSDFQLQLESLMRSKGAKRSQQENMREFGPLIQGIVRTLRYRCFFTTRHGWIGVGPYDTKPGDFCALIPGGDLPFVLRKEGTEQALVGDCYLHGIMHGELMRFARSRTALSSFCYETEFVIH
jgi:hypothetical protein